MFLWLIDVTLGSLLVVFPLELFSSDSIEGFLRLDVLKAAVWKLLQQESVITSPY